MAISNADQTKLIARCQAEFGDDDWCAAISRSVASGDLTSAQAHCIIGCDESESDPAPWARCMGRCVESSEPSTLGYLKNPIVIGVIMLAGALLLTKARVTM